MKPIYYLLIGLSVMIASYGLEGGSPAGFVTITVSNTNPLVGEVVTFTYSNSASLQATQPDNKNNPLPGQTYTVAQNHCYSPNPNYTMETSALYPEGQGGSLLFSGSGTDNRINDGETVTHIYTSPGVYTPVFDCSDGGPVPVLKGVEAKAITGIPLGLTITVGAGVPTLSHWGLIILAISLLTLGLIALGQSNLSKENIN